MPNHVYIAQCSDSSLYTGYTTDVKKRIATHNAGKGAKYTKGRIPISLLASWEFETKADALREEYRIKGLTRKDKLRLIAACGKIWKMI